MSKMRVVQVSQPNRPLELVERAVEAYAPMLSGQARFWVVLATGS